MRLHEPTEVFEDGMRCWRMTFPCQCKKDIDLWFFAEGDMNLVTAKAIHYSDVGITDSFYLSIKDVLNVIQKVLQRGSCGVPWDWETTAALVEAEL